MNTSFLVGFLQWLEREHDIDIVKEEMSDYGDGEFSSHKISYDRQLQLANEYRTHVINTGEV